MTLANAFAATVGSPGNLRTACLPLFDPRRVREERARFRRDAPPELGHANSLFVPAGRWPSRGWVLLRRADYNLITNLYRTDFQLRVNDFNHGQLTFQNLVIVQAQCVTRGLSADPGAIYLVEVTDAQGVYWNPWAQFPTTSQYNVRSPAYPEQFYSPSLNGGVPWTWNTMVGDLWGQMPLLGPYPGLPITPAGTPENYAFPGVPGWQAMNSVLDYLGLTTSEDLTKTSPYGIVVPGAADATFSALQAKYAGLLEEDYEWIDGGSGRVPGQVVVYFHRRNQFYGTEETVRRDSPQWQSTPLYSVTVAAPARFSNAAGTAYVWADFTVRYDVDGNPLAADVATANAIAAERANQYYTRVYRGTLGYVRRVYSGALPFYAGSLVDGVAWRMDYSRGRFGWVTELITGPQPPFPQVQVDPGVTYGGAD
jgi:hypothetical protein